ncbi:hypothetical protein KDH_76680 [Dictyobacter sp. S3.2.2.5]|uniref:Uncharacterized protein n=1 Tax=Dictyobacter halimunensis TaxID=3026934 RepID=A0ABQ6G2U4_9CHLR|nr:hypothetical protein KDH_76680 [Dictyobacter sp. S3.2.2.5]
MSESVSSHGSAPLRSPSSRPNNIIGRVFIFLLGLLLGISPLLISYVVLLSIRALSPVSPNAPYHGAYANFALLMLFRGLQDLLVLLLILLAPLLVHRKRTRMLGYGMVVGLLYFIAMPLVSYVQGVVMFALFHNTTYPLYWASSLQRWLNLLTYAILPIVCWILTPIFARTARHYWLGYVFAVLVALIFFFFRSPIYYWL